MVGTLDAAATITDYTKGGIISSASKEIMEIILIDFTEILITTGTEGTDITIDTERPVTTDPDYRIIRDILPRTRLVSPRGRAVRRKPIARELPPRWSLI